MKITKNPSNFIFNIFISQSKTFLLIFILITTGRTTAMLWPNVIKRLVELEKQNFQSPLMVLKLISIYLALIIFTESILRLAAYISIKPMLNITKSITLNFFSHTIQHSYHYITSYSSGMLSAKVNQVCSATDALIDLIVWVLYSLGINILVASVIFIKTNPIIGGIFLTWLFIYIPLLIMVVKTGGKRWSEVANINTLLIGRIVDSFANLFVLKCFTRKNDTNTQIINILDQHLNKNGRASYFSVHSYVFQEMSSFILCLSSMIASYYLYSTNQINIGDIVLIITLFMILKERLHSLSSRLRDTFKQYGILKDALETLSEPHHITDKKSLEYKKFKKFNIIFDNVVFGYPSQKYIFNKLTLKVKEGQKIGILGKSGSGKSTLIKLLLRFYDVNEGQILIDNINIKDVPQDYLRSYISVVPQEPILLYSSIRENILLGNPQASEEDLQKVSKLALCDSFIQTLPEGYNTIVGENGLKLSGGQKQRIAIARALLKDAPILLLDEPTSALDIDTEKEIQDTINLLKNKTVIIISHRPSILQNLDKVIILSESQILNENIAENTLIDIY